MCGACGTTASSWTERIAPLVPGSAPRRARALTALLAAADSGSARRVVVTPWHAGGLRWRGPGGWAFAPSLPATVRELTRRHGPLVPAPVPPDETQEARRLPFAVADEAAVVWCAAAWEAGWDAGTGLQLRLPTRDIALSDGTAVPAPGRDAYPSVSARHDTTRLVQHWSDALRDFAV